MTLTAPMDGKVIEQYVFPGDYVWGGNQIARIVSTGRWIELTLAEEDCAYVKNGQRTEIHLASYPDRTFQGTVTGTSLFADADKKTRTVFISVNEPDDLLVPGLSGEGVLIKDERKDAILIPRRALIGDRVLVVDGGRVAVRKVRTGFVGLDKAEIVSGVAEGELVILEGQNALRDGERVKPEAQ
jgi:RND family efflux transporter MFP subunit